MSEYEIQAKKIWMPPSRMKSINALISTSQSLAQPIFANHVFHFTGMIQEASDFNEWVDLLHDGPSTQKRDMAQY